MNKKSGNTIIREAFGNGKAFIAFLTAGDPDADSTVSYILEMEQAGADLIEIGIPFSDPTAEGPVIQEADLRALRGGMTTDGVFEIVRRVRERSEAALVFMTYLNPVFHYGYERFFQKCEELGVAGIIIPDLPFEEKEEVDAAAKRHQVALISMVAPTSEERVRSIAASAEGFLYVVSSMGVTGVRSEITTDLSSMVAAVRKVSDIPCAVGFGISTPKQAAEMAAVADGSIVGSAIVQLIARHGRNAKEPLREYVAAMKQALGKEAASVRAGQVFCEDS
ncbi:MAG: tryptophan synthase subunit alpha [Clostridium sp.]|jgi:tryptophan synthase alpha chain|nr:tryptophan synthase subunit alpha [Clostridium sp.]